MTKRLGYILYTVLLLMMLVGCTGEQEVQPQGDMEFCMRAAWLNGLASDKTTRAHSATDILADGTGDIVIDYADYPSLIEVTCSDGNYFTLSKGTSVCGSHPGYWTYTPSYLYKQKYVIRHKLSFHATAQIDDPAYSPLTDELESDFDYSNIDGNHMLLVLRHTKALLRFTFKVHPHYDKVRYVVITGIRFNEVDYPVAPKVLTTTAHQTIAYCYLDPEQADLTTKTNTIQCTYNIYDKDAVFPTPVMTEVEKEAAETELLNHLTRQDVVAQNQFTLGSMKKADGVTPVTAIEAGYYYDLKVTLNPDYLYVLSDHDNKQMVIE